MGEVRKSTCYFCHMNCGMLVEVEDGKAISVLGDPEHPFNQGSQCPRGASALKHLNHPGRINYPLKRVGNRGEGKWKRISWDEALDEIAQKLEAIRQESGAEAVASVGGTSRTDDWARRRFFNLFGSPNICHTAPVCWIPNFLAETAIMGWSAFDPEVFSARLVVIWGHDSGSTYLPEMKNFIEIRKQTGLKIMVIDPRYTTTAAKADLWLPLRPGSDGALILAWLNVIIENELYDTDFVENWTVGFEELKERVSQFTPAWASEITGLSEELIIQSATMYASFKPACIQWGVATDQLGVATCATTQARAVLKAICGNVDVPGGDVQPGPHPTFMTDEEMELNEMLAEEQRAKQLGSDKFKLMTWPGYSLLSENLNRVWGKTIPAEWMCEASAPMIWRSILSGNPYRVRALLISADNTLGSYANVKLIYQALKEVDFLVVMEYWMTPTASLADYVLPIADWVERPTMTTVYGVSDWIIASERGVQPLYERRTDFEVWRELGLRLGQSEYWPWETLEDAYQYRIEPLGYGLDTYDEFVEEVRMDFAPRNYYKYMEQGFATPSGKVELRSSIFEQLGYDPLPHWVDPLEEETKEKYPLILIAGGGFMPFFHTEHRQNPWLRPLQVYPKATINPRTAKELGINDGDWVYIENDKGKIRMRAYLSEAVAPGIVHGERGWWYPEREGKDPELFGIFESNVNVLVDDDPEKCDPCTGSWNTRAVRCKVYKAEVPANE